MNFSAELAVAYPELILAIGALALLVFGAFAPRLSTVVGWASVVLLAAAAYVAATQPLGSAFAGGLVFDAGAAFSKVAIYVASAVCIPLGQRWFARRGVTNFEFPILILIAALGMGMMASS